jgi:hypothetical protein
MFKDAAADWDGSDILKMLCLIEIGVICLKMLSLCDVSKDTASDWAVSDVTKDAAFDYPATLSDYNIIKIIVLSLSQHFSYFLIKCLFFILLFCSKEFVYY